jgi:hypothetical protein
MEPGVSVKREIRMKPVRADMNSVNIIYHFYKNDSKLFSVCILPRSNSISNDFYQMENLEASILCDNVSSDFICKGDDSFREMRVLCQLAEKMYETQNALKKLKSLQTRKKALADNEISSNKR